MYLKRSKNVINLSEIRVFLLEKSGIFVVVDSTKFQS